MPYQLVARSGGGDAWFFPANPGQPKLGPFTLPDGRDAYELIDNGDTAGLPFTPTFREEQTGRRGDLLWTGCATKIASDRLINALASFGGWHTFDIILLDRDGAAVPGYQGFAVDGPDGDVFWSTGFQHERFGITEAALQAIKGAGIDGLEIDPL